MSMREQCMPDDRGNEPDPEIVSHSITVTRSKLPTVRELFEKWEKQRPDLQCIGGTEIEPYFQNSKDKDAYGNSTYRYLLYTFVAYYLKKEAK